MKEISAALVKAQKEFGPALKTSTNPAFRSKYANLSACIEAVIDGLNNNGIMLMQPVSPCEDGVIVETLFIHESGEQMGSGKLHVPASKHDAQGYGSALTYARRYSLMAACGIAPEDDDGQAAVASKPKAKPVAQAQKPAPTPKPAAAPEHMEGKDGPWQLKISAEPDGDFTEWAKLVTDAVEMGLANTETESEVMSLFRANKNIFDRIKEEPGSNAYEALLAMFKEARSKFQKAGE